MATSFTIPALTIPTGQTIFGPTTPGAGLAGLILTLDIAALTPKMNVRIEHSEDGGVTWQAMAIVDAEGPSTIKGVLHTDMTLEANFGNVAGPNQETVPILSTATTRVRAVVNNTTAFHSAGGTLATY